MTAEAWLPVVGWPDYLVSDQGRVATVKRNKAQIMRGWVDEKGYRRVTLRAPGARRARPVHALVAEAFLGSRPAGQQVRHLDGDSQNNRVYNLRFGTGVENMQDRLAHGRHPMAAKTHCKRDHEFTPENTWTYRGRRFCRTCKAARSAESKHRVALAAANVRVTA